MTFFEEYKVLGNGITAQLELTLAALIEHKPTNSSPMLHTLMLATRVAINSP